MGGIVPKRKALTASAVAYLMGFEPPAKSPDGKLIRYGRKAMVGQYTKPYVRVGHLPAGAVIVDDRVDKHPPVGRVSKGARKRYVKNHGTEGVLDYSAVINARR